jgi:hypothetical protein
MGGEGRAKGCPTGTLCLRAQNLPEYSSPFQAVEFFSGKTGLGEHLECKGCPTGTPDFSNQIIF